MTSFFNDWTDENADAKLPTPVPGRPGPRRLRRWLTAAVPVALAAAVTATLLLPGLANADPSPSTWYRLRVCESGNNYSINTGNSHYGAYQFDLATWRSVGGQGYPNLASAAEQDLRALILYRMRGWAPWQCASILGLREDSDARSGRTSDLGRTSSGSSFPASGYFTVGANNALIAKFQKQMHTRGAPLVGTGQFGPITHGVVWRLQALNGIPATGHLGPVTYRLAWTGRYFPTVHYVVPRFPGTRVYHYGDWNSSVAAFQKKMGSRGAPLTGTGEFGPKTTAVVKRLQALNGIAPSGQLGPVTWRMAWIGRYSS